MLEHKMKDTTSVCLDTHEGMMKICAEVCKMQTKGAQSTQRNVVLLMP